MAQPFVETVVPRVSVADYLAAEQVAEVKHEYRDGLVIAMPGASRNHVLITPKIVQLIENGIGGGPCIALDQDVQVLIPGLRTYTYPDAAIACPPVFDEGPTAILLNPKVIFEVLSPSTEAYDRGQKFRNYRRISTLEEYVLISSEQFVVEVFQAPEWGIRTYENLDDVAEIRSVGLSLPLREIYARLIDSDSPH